MDPHQSPSGNLAVSLAFPSSVSRQNCGLAHDRPRALLRPFWAAKLTAELTDCTHSRTSLMDISINSVLGDIECDVACQCLVGSDLAMGVASERDVDRKQKSLGDCDDLER